MNLKILSAGILDTLQDGGRYGYRHSGINPCGVMDVFSAAAANILVGNAGDTAVLEMHYPASSFRFTQSALIAIGGAGFSPTINGEPAPVLQPVFMRKNDILQFSSPSGGARTYLAVHGGFRTEQWLGSGSTHLKLAHSGYKGRKLKKNDALKINEGVYSQAIKQMNTPTALPWKIIPLSDDSDVISVLRGKEWEQLSEASMRLFEEREFQITIQSDRMGYRLEGEVLNRINSMEMISAAVNFGTVQLLPDGQLIVLMADHQTTGGYPRIAHVVTAHLGRLAQMKAGDKVRFRCVTQQQAEKMLLEKESYLQQLKTTCALHLEEWIRKNSKK